jgi:uncharacterized protein YggT (Ycf19 family)
MNDYERTTVTREQVDPVTTRGTVVRRTSGPGPLTVMQRALALIFGVIQALIVLRIVLLLLIANRNNDIVMAIMNTTDVLVEPFRGMFRLDHVNTQVGAVLDVAAIVALIGWTLIEGLVLAVLRLGDRGTVETA